VFNLFNALSFNGLSDRSDLTKGASPKFLVAEKRMFGMFGLFNALGINDLGQILMAS
jgi:hypothetical protein